MIVIRVFDVLDGLCSQFATHVFCCGSGTCPDPDGVRYETRKRDPYCDGSVVEQIVEMVHDQLSELGDQGVSEITADHLRSMMG